MQHLHKKQHAHTHQTQTHTQKTHNNHSHPHTPTNTHEHKGRAGFIISGRIYAFFVRLSTLATTRAGFEVELGPKKEEGKAGWERG